MKIESKKYLFDIQTSAQKIFKFLEKISYEQYHENDLLKSAVERQFEIIGEALNQLIKKDPDMQKEFPEARDIIAFRNLLIHGYAQVDDRLVWNITETRLPSLLGHVETLLQS